MHCKLFSHQSSGRTGSKPRLVVLILRLSCSALARPRSLWRSDSHISLGRAGSAESCPWDPGLWRAKTFSSNRSTADSWLLNSGLNFSSILIVCIIISLIYLWHLRWKNVIMYGLVQITTQPPTITALVAWITFFCICKTQSCHGILNRNKRTYINCQV